MKRSYSIIKKYLSKFLKLNTDIKIIDKYDYYIIYFLDKKFFNDNIDIIDEIYNESNDKYKKQLLYLPKDILYGCFYDFYIDNKDFENDLNNALCKDLTDKFIRKYNKVQIDNKIELLPTINSHESVDNNSYNYTLKICNTFIYNRFNINGVSKKYKKEKNNCNRRFKWKSNSSLKNLVFL